MTYPQEFTDIQRMKLQRIVETIDSLDKGQSTLINAKTPAMAQELKYLTYAYLSPLHSNRKDEFILRSTPDKKSFSITRRDDCDYEVTQVKAPKEHPLLENYISITDEEQLIDLMHNDEISINDQLVILDQWRRIHK